MKKIFYYIFYLFILFSINFSVSCVREKDYSDCYPCDNDVTISTIENLDAKVVSFPHDPVVNNIPTITFGFTIASNEVADNGNSFVFSDSLLVPCPKMPREFQVGGKKVKISGRIKSCNRLLSCYFCTLFYGRKFELTKIQ